MTIQQQFFNELGRIIREKRAGHQISQRELSKKIEVSKRAISTIENGGRISEENTELLINYFGIDATVVIVENTPVADSE